MGDRLCDGLKGLLDRYGLPFVAYNQAPSYISSARAQ